MNAVLLDVGSPETCYPVVCTRRLAACLIANQSLLDIQTRRLTAGGFTVASPSAHSPALYLRLDSWLSMEALHRLAATTTKAVLSDEREILAWINTAPDLPLGAVRVPGDQHCFRIRYPWDLLAVNELMVGALTQDAIAGEVSSAAHIEGHLVLGPGARILPGVMIEGNVLVGAYTRIGPNCYVRGNTSIGERCHIGQAVEIKNSIVMNGVHLAHLSYCGDSIIGENANLGAGTIISNFRHDGQNHRSLVNGILIDTGRRKFGAVIGDGVHTGIHTSIYPGRKLWPGVTTRPGAIVQNDLRPEAVT
jgi:bifunctional UDP-N-acetylglucosamine pyrophosphorylase/glucosamine-1-phosphate N-acetyltransferase